MKLRDRFTGKSEEAGGFPAPPAPPIAAPSLPSAPGSSAPQTRTITINMTGVSTEFEPLPVGLYAATTEEVKFEPHSKKSGQPYIKFTFACTEPQFQGRKFFHNCSLQQDALWKLAKTVDALGVELPSEGDFNLDLDGLVGLPCVVSLTVGEYQGKTKNEIVEVLPASDFALSSASVVPQF